MRKPEWRKTIRKRPVRLFLVLAAAFLAVLAWRRLSPSHVTILPFTYSAVQGSIRLRVRVAEQPHTLELNTLWTQTALGRRLYQQLSQEEVGMDRPSPATDFAVGNVRSQLFYAEVEETALHPYTEGIVGCDLFAPSPGFEGRNVRPGARITLDFKTNRLKLEDSAELEPLTLPKGTLQAPLLRDGDGPYYLLLPLNNGASYRFALGIGSRDVLLPTGAVLFPDPEGRGYVNAAGMVPVTLTVGGQDVTVLAIALPGAQTTGVLGMNLLANYRVVIDFRNRRLYLEPPDSRSDL